jgi:hypothetical protein
MIALRFLPREEWEAQLSYYKCRPMRGTMPLNTAEWWVSSWGFFFTVPVEEDGSCHLSSDYGRAFSPLVQGHRERFQPRSGQEHVREIQMAPPSARKPILKLDCRMGRVDQSTGRN